jgi:hypothetical protein
MLRLRPIARCADDCAALSTTDFRLRGNHSSGKECGFDYAVFTQLQQSAGVLQPKSS